MRCMIAFRPPIIPLYPLRRRMTPRSIGLCGKPRHRAFPRAGSLPRATVQHKETGSAAEELGHGAAIDFILPSLLARRKPCRSRLNKPLRAGTEGLHPILRRAMIRCSRQPVPDPCWAARRDARWSKVMPDRVRVMESEGECFGDDDARWEAVKRRDESLPAHRDVGGGSGARGARNRSWPVPSPFSSSVQGNQLLIREGAPCRE
jgi:hypothetical protein